MVLGGSGGKSRCVARGGRPWGWGGGGESLLHVAHGHGTTRVEEVHAARVVAQWGGRVWVKGSGVRAAQI